MAMIVNIIVGAAFAASLLFVLIVWKKSEKIYDEYLAPLNEEEFKYKKYMPVGLYLNEKINLTKWLPLAAREMLARYSSSVRIKIGELYGSKYADYYYQIHGGNKWLFAVVGFILVIAFAGVNCVNNEHRSAIICLVAAPIVAVALSFFMDIDLDGKIDDRREKIKIDFPEFINKLLLLVNAGMTISKAWEKIVTENKKRSPLYDELNVSLAEIRAGKPEAVAYEEFARRCKVKEIIKFVSVIILNLKKGGSEVVPTLRAQADECWEMRKATARRMGEKASSKLMLPMAIMLIGIILIVALPAVLALTGV